jgi:hypothetical protein
VLRVESFVACDRFEVMLPGMDWQQTVSLGVVASTAVLLVGSKFRRRKFSFERDTLCGCVAVQKSSPQSSIVFRARKGQRPEVLVKMR